MKLAFLSHKECWADAQAPSGYATVGGFPFHVKGIAGLFDETILQIALRSSRPPPGASPIVGHHLKIKPLIEPTGRGWRRKLALLPWSFTNLPRIWRMVSRVDAVHVAVPGDIGTLGILIALAQRKPLFVRHCGTWGEPVTMADHFLLWLLERIAGGRNVVMATGGGGTPPSARNADVQWIFSTSITEEEWQTIQPARLWKRGMPLRLVTVGRLSPGKNTTAMLQTLPLLQKQDLSVHLDVVGGGPLFETLKTQATTFGVSHAVTFHGNVAHEEVLRILSCAHLFVFPTRVKEGFPKAVLEAMACGLPVIATGVSVLPHLIGTHNGRVLDTPTPEAVANAILDMVADEKEFAATAIRARTTSQQYTLEQWQATIGKRLQDRWGPLKESMVPGSSSVKAEAPA